MSAWDIGLQLHGKRGRGPYGKLPDLMGVMEAEKESVTPNCF